MENSETKDQLSKEETTQLEAVENSSAGHGLTFESAEHTSLGNSITLKFPSGDVIAGDFKIPLPNNLSLTYGQILALGGDFYGIVGKPISDGATEEDRENRFTNAYNSLATQPSSFKEVNEILGVMDEEINAVNKAIKEGKPVSSVYEELGDSLSKKWNVITGGGDGKLWFFNPGRYLKLAAENWDHFGFFAVSAYQAGHMVAMKQAKSAASISNSADQKLALDQAYAMNAFADHFLTDLFSSGHIRTPRKALGEIPFSSASIGGLLARAMHGEDGVNGLHVSNKNGDEWMSYGDSSYFDKIGEQNAKLSIQAAQESANEIYEVFSGAEILSSDQFKALNIIPNLKVVQDYENLGKNFSPMFVKSADDHVLMRAKLNDPMDKNWLPTLEDAPLFNGASTVIFLTYGRYKGPNWHLNS